MQEPPKLFGESRRTNNKNKKSAGFNFPDFNIPHFIGSLFNGFLKGKSDKSTASKTPHGQSPQKKRRPPKKQTFTRFLFRIFLTLGVWIMGFVMLGILWFSYDLPDINQLQSSSRKPGVIIQAVDGTTIGAYGNLYEGMIKVSELPPYVPQALMAIEDRRFYHHFGVDIIGLARAAYTNYKANRIVQGGSTITQQLAKNFLQAQGKYDIHDKSLRRKVQEVIMSVWLEWKFTKEQIMTMYLNRVYFGSATFGIEAASRRYFHKSAKELSVYEAAVIAGLLKAPSRYSPNSNPVRARERATLVLTQMADAGYIRTVEEHLKSVPIQSAEEIMDMKGAHFFADWVYEQVPSIIGAYDQDLVIRTTFDPQIQHHAEIATRKVMEEMSKGFRTTQIALVAMTPQGAVRAMIGGMNYGKSQYNRVTQALRQPGSTFKPFVYLAGLESGMTPDTYFSDEPVSIGGWNPGNFRKYKPKGEITMHRALAESVNTVTVRIAAHTGFRKIVKTARRLGITSDMISDWSVCLGAMEVTLLELTGAYATFANKGNSVSPYGILEIRTRRGEVLYQYQDTDPIEVIAPTQLNQMNRMLTEVIDNGTGRRAKLSCPVAGKSGSNADKDAWFIGFTSDLVAGIWTGNDNNAPMHQDSTGGRLPATTFAAFMKPIVEGKTPEEILALESAEAVNSEVTEVSITGINEGEEIVEGDTFDEDILKEIDIDEDLKIDLEDHYYKDSAQDLKDDFEDRHYKGPTTGPSPKEDDFGNEPALEPGEFDNLIEQAMNE